MRFGSNVEMEEMRQDNASRRSDDHNVDVSSSITTAYNLTLSVSMLEYHNNPAANARFGGKAKAMRVPLT